MSEVVKGKSEKTGFEWQRMNIILDVPGYQGAITQQMFTAHNGAVEQALQFKVGDKVEIGWSMYCREYNGKTYNNIDLVKISSTDTPAFTPVEKPQPMAAPEIYQPEDLNPESHIDDLPF